MSSMIAGQVITAVFSAARRVPKTGGAEFIFVEDISHLNDILKL